LRRRLILRQRSRAAMNEPLRLGSRRCGGRAAFFGGCDVLGRSSAGGRFALCPRSCRLLGLFSRRSYDGRSCGLLLLLLLLLNVAFVKLLRHTLLDARNAVRENWLALARQLLLGVEEVEHIGRIPIGQAAAAASQDAAKRDQNGGGDQSLRAAHKRFLIQTC